MSELGRIGTNGVNEFFEDLTYNVAYNEVLSRLNNAIDMDNDMVKQAIQSSLTIMVSSALFLYIQKQEELINKVIKIVFSILSSVITFLGASIASKFGRFKGRKLKNVLNFFNDYKSDCINAGRLAVQTGAFYVSKNSNVNSGSSLVLPSVLKQGQIIQSEDHKLNIARAKAQSINETLLFKLFTKKFTPADLEMLKRITGNRDLTIENLNKVANFMYVTDDKGNIVGLTEEFLTMLNGLGYMHNKIKRGI